MTIPAQTSTAAWNLIERTQAGDREAFGEIYERYVDHLYRFVYWRTGNHALTEDIVADTFLRALTRINTVTWQGKDPGAWLTTIARNLLADHYKSHRYRYTIVVDDWGFTDLRDKDTDIERDTLDELAHTEACATLRAALARLTPEQRRCIELRYLNECSLAATAAALGLTEGAVKALAYRALNSLSRHMGGVDSSQRHIHGCNRAPRQEAADAP